MGDRVKKYDVCEHCGKLIQTNKFLIGRWHRCTSKGYSTKTSQFLSNRRAENELKLIEMKNNQNKKKERRGFTSYSAEGGGLLNNGHKYSGIVEVIEKERLGELSRVEVVSCSGGVSINEISDYFEGWQESNLFNWETE